MISEDLAESIKAGAECLPQDLPPGAAEKLAHLLAELRRWNRRINLTAITSPAAMVSGHVLDSLSIRAFLEGRRVIDVGTGAGFPGLPLAIAEPDIEFELLDSNGKKISFVRHAIGEIGVPNATAIKARVEDYAPGKRFDTVIARALASVARLVELAGHLVVEDGVMLVHKGRYPADELQDIADAWEYSVNELAVPGLDARHVVALRRRNT
ncbi:MAG: 16S rRNA (guanine(527)-N(7))-methyltransferase RsmG [Woeseiaceae bacterium]